MAQPSIGYGRFKARGVAELIDAAFTLYRRNFLLVVAVVAVAVVPYSIVSFTVSRAFAVPTLNDVLSQLFSSRTSNALNTTGVQVALVLLGVLNTVIVRPVALGALSAVTSARYLDRSITLGETYRAVARRIGGVLIVGLFMGLVYAPSFIAQVSLDRTLPQNPTLEQQSAALGNTLLVGVLGLAAFAATIPLVLAVPAVVVEGVSGLRGLARSWHLVRGAYWRTLGLVILLDVIVGVLQLALTTVLSLPGSALSGAASLAVDQAALAVGLVFATPIAMITFALLYYDRRIRREAFDIEMLAASL